jgi:hypothetical protein
MTELFQIYTLLSKRKNDKDFVRYHTWVPGRVVLGVKGV